MPLLMCPNDSASMTNVSRNGVEFDMCPSCRGVWLDRGELEKLIAAGARPVEDETARSTPPSAPPIDRFRHDRDERHDDRYRPKKRRDIFDIFD